MRMAERTSNCANVLHMLFRPFLVQQMCVPSGSHNTFVHAVFFVALPYVNVYHLNSAHGGARKRLSKRCSHAMKTISSSRDVRSIGNP